MPGHQNTVIRSDELDILQEVMNIAFGKASADLAEHIDIYVKLSVPDVRVIPAVRLPSYFVEMIGRQERVSIVEQKFWGKFSGYALLLFASGADSDLISILSCEDPDLFHDEAGDELAKGALMEIGNIVVGACVGKIAELLNDVMVYSPPVVLLEKSAADIIPDEMFNPEDSAVILKALFRFENRAVSGMLVLLFSQTSVAWLKKALKEFMEQYE
ncbi:MAG: chemotaxis protein CheC [Syntrophales bacterium]|jgi:chemotaxis protein CheC|nr:chemotaxis protein CheC [Syntrophales bacterium]